MAVSINGTTGVSGVDGSAGTPALQGTDTNTGISFGTDEVAINTGGTERAKVDSSGRLLVGTSSAFDTYNTGTNYLAGLEKSGTGSYAALALKTNSNDATGAYLALSKSRSTTANGKALVSNSDTLGEISFEGTDGTSILAGAFITAKVDGTPGLNDLPTRLTFSTTADGASSPTERMRIRSDGHLHASVNTTDSEYFNSSSTHLFHQDTGSRVVAVFENSGNSLPSGILIDFSDSSPDNNNAYFMTGLDSTTTRFRIWSDGDLDNHDNSYGGTSDQKLKQDIVDAGSQWDDLKDLRVRKFKFKSDVAAHGDKAKTLIGLVAQEAETVCPGLVKNNPDLDEEGNDLGTVTKTVRYSVLYMKAVKALQEAMERIETLEQRLSDAGIA